MLPVSVRHRPLTRRRSRDAEWGGGTGRVCVPSPANYEVWGASWDHLGVPAEPRSETHFGIFWRPQSVHICPSSVSQNNELGLPVMAWHILEKFSTFLGPFFAIYLLFWNRDLTPWCCFLHVCYDHPVVNKHDHLQVYRATMLCLCAQPLSRWHVTVTAQITCSWPWTNIGPFSDLLVQC